MEFIELMEKARAFLEKSFFFKTARFAIGLYLIIMVVVIVGVLYRIGKIYWVILLTGQEFPVTKGRMQKKWEKIKGYLETNNSSWWKAAVLEVSEMLYEILDIVGYKGKTLGEKLATMLPSQLENLEEVKEANLIRNKIVKDKEFELSKEEAQRVVSVFAQALNFFEAIEDRGYFKNNKK